MDANDSITIPNQLPIILKEYTKSVLKTQPDDLIKWSAEYFRAMTVKSGIINKQIETEDALYNE